MMSFNIVFFIITNNFFANKTQEPSIWIFNKKVIQISTFLKISLLFLYLSLFCIFQIF